MATRKVFLGNIKGPKGDPYILTDDDVKMIVDEVSSAITPEVWSFVDKEKNSIDKLVYTGTFANEVWTFTLEDGSVVEKGVYVK